MTDYKVNFRDLKARVGVDDVAYHLGYRLDRAAGVGRYIEMVQCDSNGLPQDTIIIKNPANKAEQTFFRRNGERGDVIALIKENINSFHVSGRNEWDTVIKVLAQFANEPIPEYGNSEYLYKAGYRDNRDFDISRYEVKPVENNIAQAMAFFERRGITEDTVRTFAPYLNLVRDLQQTSYQYDNLGFPYREPGSDKILGFEVRGIGGFKGKAAGTNSSSAAWIADLSADKNPHSVYTVYFAESGYDIMAFYQANKVRLEKEHSVFVSIGGTFSDKQITGIMHHYAGSRAIDCFDNDLPGRVYGIRMAALVEKMSVNIIKEGNSVRIKISGKDLLFDENSVSLKELCKSVSMRYKVGQWKAPENFKDWNDVVMNKPEKVVETKTKFQRNERLRQARGFKRGL